MEIIVLCSAMIIFLVTQAKPRNSVRLNGEALLKTSNSAPRRYRRVVTGLMTLAQACAGAKPTRRGYSDPLVKSMITCHGLLETICRTSHASCGKSTVNHGYPKVQPDFQKVVTIPWKGIPIYAIQTMNCTCAC